jgi:hypothetical protein
MEIALASSDYVSLTVSLGSGSESVTEFRYRWLIEVTVRWSLS